MSTDPKDVKGFQLLQGVAAQALDDDDYHQQLLDDPKQVLRDAGLEISDDLEVVIHENTPNRVHLVLPVRVEDWTELDLDEIDIELLLFWPF